MRKIRFVIVGTGALLVTISGAFAFTNRGILLSPTIPPVLPVSISFATNPVSVADSTGANVTVTGFTVNMSDGSVYSGTPTGACATQSPCPFSVGGSKGAWVVKTAATLSSSYDISNASYIVTAN